MRKRRPRQGRFAKNRQRAVREPSVAGILYPAQKRALEEGLDRLWQRGAPLKKICAALAPHGALRTSGPVAAAVFSRIRGPETAVVVGPDHCGLGKRCSLELGGDWITPLGSLGVDEKLARRIMNHSGEVETDPDAQAQEHSVEMILPFLQRIGSVRRFVPVLLGADDLETARKVGLGIAQAIRGMSASALLVASAHLTSYQPGEAARKNDPGTLERILAMDEERLWQWIIEQQVSMCGGAAVAAVLVAAKALGASAGHLVKYEMNSPSGGQSESVNGYAGVTFS